MVKYHVCDKYHVVMVNIAILEHNYLRIIIYEY